MKKVDGRTVIIVIVLLVIAVGVISFSEIRQKNKDNPTETTTISEVVSDQGSDTTLGESVSSTTQQATGSTTVASTNAETIALIEETTVAPSEDTQEFKYNILQPYLVGDYVVTLYGDKTFSLGSATTTDKINGAYEAYSCDEAIKEKLIDKQDLLSVGMPYNKIQQENMVFVRLFLNTHTFGENIEYYSYDLLRDECLDCLIYFKEDGQSVTYAMNNINNKIDNYDISQSLF